MVTLPQGQSQWIVVREIQPWLKGCRLCLQQYTERACPPLRENTLLHSWHEAFRGAVFRRTEEEEVTFYCCAKVKGNGSIPGASHQASVSWLPWRLLRGEEFFDGHSSCMATSSRMFKQERRMEGVSHLNLQQSPVLH